MGDRVCDGLAGSVSVLRAFFFLGDRPVFTFRREIVRALRAHARQPLVAAAIVSTLALGLGVNAAAFQLVNAFILHPLPGLNVDGLVMLSEQSPRATYSKESVAPANFYEWRREAKSLDKLAIFDWWEVNLAGGSEPVRVLGFQVTGDFFDMFGLVPTAGRFLSEADEAPGAAHVVVMSDRLWKHRFGARPDVIGQSLRIGGESYTVVGVAPEGFAFPNTADVWGPYPHTAENAANRKDRSLTAFGRLAPGVTIAQARQEAQTLYTRMRATYPHDNDGLTANVRTLAEGMRDDGSPQVVAMIQVAALLVLLIGGTNIANLLIARGWDRQRETAVRLAIGANRSHVLRQFAVESLVLGLPAVPLALGMAWVSLHAMRAAMPARIERFIPGWSLIAVDWRLAFVTLVAALVAALLFSVVPALQTSRPALSQALGQGGRTMTGGARRQRFRRALVITEIALALPLLVAAGLSTLAARRLATGPQGFDPSGVLVMRMELPDTGFADPIARRDFNDRLLARVSALPGVQAAGTVNHLPSSNSSSSQPIVVEGTTLAPNQPPPMVVYRVISPGYLETMRIPIQRGRDFTSVDRENAQPVAIVSAAMSHQFWPDADPIGRRLQLAGADSPWYTVVGIAGNIIDDWFDRRNAATVYLPMAQRPQVLRGAGGAHDRRSVQVRARPSARAPRGRSVSAGGAHAHEHPRRGPHHWAANDRRDDGGARRARARARGDRHLRVDGVLRRAAAAGDWHPARARRVAGLGRPHDGLGRRAARAGRAVGRAAARGRALARHGKRALRHRERRTCALHRDHRDPRDHVPDREPRPRATCGVSGSGAGTQDRVTRNPPNASNLPNPRTCRTRRTRRTPYNPFHESHARDVRCPGLRSPRHPDVTHAAHGQDARAREEAAARLAGDRRPQRLPVGVREKAEGDLNKLDIRSRSRRS